MIFAIANWKSHKTATEVNAWLANFLAGYTASESDGTSVILAVPFPFISLVTAKVASLPGISVAVQDISSFPAGAYTGAVSAYSLQGMEVKNAIVGHSERRQYFKETHQDIANKVAQCLAFDIQPILCVDDEYITQQAAALSPEQARQCIIAYEDTTSIGTGRSQDPAKVSAVVEQIRHAFGAVPVLYGGSVTPENAGQYAAVSDGVLVGSASLDAQQFLAITATLKQTLKTIATE